MAGRAGRAKYLVVQADPVRVEVGFRLGPGADLDVRDEIILAFHDRHGMAEITFQADGLLLVI